MKTTYYTKKKRGGVLPSLLSVTELIRRVVLFLLYACIAAMPVLAIASSEPIDVAADAMTSSEKNNSVTFIGNVDARQGDVRIRANKMVVYYTPKDSKAEGKQSRKKSAGPGAAAGAQQVEKMICTGKVEISRADWLGTGDRMDYLERKRKIILTGNARAFKGQNQVQGSKIIYYLDEHRSEVVNEKKDKGKKGGYEIMGKGDGSFT